MVIDWSIVLLIAAAIAALAAPWIGIWIFLRWAKRQLPEDWREKYQGENHIR